MSEKKEYTTDDVIAETNKWIIDVLSGNIHERSDVRDQTVALTDTRRLCVYGKQKNSGSVWTWHSGDR